MSESTRPKPPESIDGEALLEWQQITADLDAAGLLEKTDRAVLILYCNTWSIYQGAMRHVAKFGPVVKLPNAVVCGSPYYNVAQDTLKQLRGLLNDMGLTFKTRPRLVAQPTDELPI